MNHPSHHFTAFLKPLPLHFHEMKDSPPPPPPHHFSQTSPFICQRDQESHHPIPPPLPTILLKPLPLYVNEAKDNPPPHTHTHTHITFLNTFPTHFQQTKDHTPSRPPLLDSQDGLEREASSTGPTPSISSSERKKQIKLYHGLGNQNTGLPA